MNDLKSGILVVDFGSQTTLLIARRLRELGVYSEVWSCFDERLQQPLSCLGVVLSGGPASVFAADAPTLPEAALEAGVPVLGICYGMQLLVERFGGRIEAGQVAEYGRTELRKMVDSRLLADLSVDSNDVVWMSHGDELTRMPEGFVLSAQSVSGAAAAIEHDERQLFGLQFHPEVSHTERGRAFLNRFAKDVCGARGDWSMGALKDELIAAIAHRVGPDERVVCGLSGGVDSSVTAALIAAAIGPRLLCVMVDNGLLRAGEVEEVVDFFGAHFDAELKVIDASDDFLGRLAGVIDPELKRKRIGAAFIDAFVTAVDGVEGVRFLAQGTLYPDVIESVSAGGPSVVIKSHHNVGGLPDLLPFELIEPLRALFKDEVRELGHALGLPQSILGRHPFPGPGLAIRVLGEVTRERVEIARKADAIFIGALREEGLYDQVWQAFVALLPVKTVGVMGDARTYESVAALRAVSSVDGMTASRSALSLDFLGRVADRIINQIKGINRVVYDITNKPPGTIEWE